ncbi:hypothetical protein [Argonema galeatum]|uniref:HD domain-containing protein n=1 Tax=Argonema galeatum TaxID=2942762 RepID=UPI0020122C84|nr:hypothetical protein [Argonema galeatum]MCL1467884.1 hypothetical protein [Argonema galeatum A003/A1]
MVKQSAIAFSRWQSLLQPFRVEQSFAQLVFSDLTAAYSNSARFYHTLAHIQQILETIYMMNLQAPNLAALEFAAWFHDVIYDPKAKDNEEKSAAYAANVLTNLAIPAETIDRSVNIILATQKHQARENDFDCQIFLDADLSILGSSEAKYREYAQAIAQEYSWLSEGEYRSGRKQVLQNFLKRERIYFTEQIFTTLEDKARQNIQEEIKYLSSGNSNKI